MRASVVDRGCLALLAVALVSGSAGCSVLFQVPAHRAPRGSYPRCSPSHTPGTWDLLGGAFATAGGVTLLGDREGGGPAFLLSGAILLASGIYGTVSAYRCEVYRAEASKYIATEVITAGAEAPPTPEVPEVPNQDVTPTPVEP